MSEIEGGGGGSVESGGGEVSSSSEVSETSTAETGGESSEATQEAATEEAGESGGFDEDTDTTESPEDSAEEYDESDSEGEPDDSQEVGFSDGDDVDNADSQYDGSDYENDDTSSGDEDGVGFDDSDEDISDGIDEDTDSDADSSDSPMDEDNDESFDEPNDYEDESSESDLEDQENEDIGETEDYSDEESLDDRTEDGDDIDDAQDDGETQTEDSDSTAAGDESDGDMDNDGEPDGNESDAEADTEDSDDIDDAQDDGEAQTEDTDPTADGDESDGDMDNDGEPDGNEADTEADTEDSDDIDDDWDAQEDEDAGEPEDYSDEDSLDNGTDDVQDDGEAQTEDTDSTADGDESDGDMDNDSEPDDTEADTEADTENGDDIDDAQDDGEAQTEDTDSTADGNEADGDMDNDGELDGAEADTESDIDDDDYNEDEDPGELEEYSDGDTDNRNEDDDSTDDSESERDQEEEQAVEENKEATERAENEAENADVENADKNVDDAAESKNKNPAENGVEQQSESADANSTNEVDTENDASRTGDNNNGEAQADASDNKEDNSTDTRDQNEEQPDDIENKAETPEGEDAYRTAMNNMAEYMSKHNYGPDDYAEYSKDPEWYKLNSELQQSLGMEVTPPTPEVAMSNMSDYMNEHNYGPDDYSEYSKDPEWQKLNADLQQSLGMEVTTDVSTPSPESGKDVSATELPDNCVMVNASDIDMTYAQGMDSEQFWNHHGNTKEDYMRVAERIPDVQQALNSGKSLDEIKQDPELKDTAHAYFDPENMIKVEQQADGSYSFADDGRHRIAAAQEMGYEIPVEVANAGNNIEPQGGTGTSDSPSENHNALDGSDGSDNPPPPPDGGDVGDGPNTPPSDGGDGPGGPPEKEFGKEQLNVAAHGDDPNWVKSSDIKNKLDEIGRSDLSAKVDEAIGKLKNEDSQASKEFVSAMREAGNELSKNEATADCGNALLNLVNKNEQALKIENGNETQEYNGLEQENSERVEGVKEITQHYYDDARTLAQGSEIGQNFTDHTEAHVEQVAEKSLEAADALESAIDKGTFKIESDDPDHVELVGNIDKSVLEGAALSHDTGMSGNGYALEYYKGEDGKKHCRRDEEGNIVVKKENNANFDEVRENHSLNSAINVLADREKYKELGYSDSQVDMMAAECMAHSKSSSGVADLNSRSDWGECFDRIDAAIDQYNKDHPDEPNLTFDRKRFESNDEKMGQLATSTLALRVGDVSRDSGPEAISQSGKKVYVDRNTVNDAGGTKDEEVKNAEITRGENREEITNEISRPIHVGEQNIVENHTICNEDGSVVHEIKVDDANSAPKCTQKAISDHIGEFASASGGNFIMDIDFNTPTSEKTKDDPVRKSYDDFRNDMQAKYKNIEITYPWDKEVKNG